MLGVVHTAARRLVLADAGHAHAGGAELAHQLGLEHHVARLVGLAVGAGHGVGVGQVGGHDVQPLALRADRAAADVEDLEHAHGSLVAPCAALGPLSGRRGTGLPGAGGAP